VLINQARLVSPVLRVLVPLELLVRPERLVSRPLEHQAL
jgi:hypothetical protein